MKSDVLLDAKGLACPMPIVKTKKAMTNLDDGQVLEIHATDKGSKADLQAWAERTGHQYLGTLEQEGVLKHYLRKSSDDEAIERKHPHVISNEELQEQLQASEAIVVVDVREETEFAFHHIPSAISIPLGELESRLHELNKEAELFVICRTGNRSDLAAQKLTANGFEKVMNVVPGMSTWVGHTNKKI